MTINRHPGPEEQRALTDRALEFGHDPAQHVQKLFRDDLPSHPRPSSRSDVCARERTTDGFIDHEFVAYCE
jgi:hypothetical protein